MMRRTIVALEYARSSRKDASVDDVNPFCQLINIYMSLHLLSVYGHGVRVRCRDRRGHLSD